MRKRKPGRPKGSKNKRAVKNISHDKLLKIVKKVKVNFMIFNGNIFLLQKLRRG